MIRPTMKVAITQNRIPHLSKRLQSMAGRNCEIAAKGIVASAQSRVHVITGELRGSIEAEKFGPNNWLARVGADYGPYEEYGTVYRPGHPYWTPAVLEWGSKFQANMDRLLNEL